MSSRKITLCNRALIRLGCNRISRLDGDAAEQVVLNELYDGVREELLGMYPWRFASRLVPLEAVADAPEAVWAQAFQLPEHAKHVFSVLVRDEPVPFDRYERFIFTDARVEDLPVARVGFFPDEAYWPAHFDGLFVVKLAAAAAMPLTEDNEKASLYEGMALRQFGAAKTFDAQGRTPSKIEVGGLRRYHGGNSARSFRADPAT